MPAKVIFHPLARRELQVAALYYEDHSFGLGSAFRAEAREFLGRILANPLGYSIRIADVRRANLKRFPYHLNYILHGEDIAVVAVSHHRQRPHYWRERVADRRWMSRDQTFASPTAMHSVACVPANVTLPARPVVRPRHSADGRIRRVFSGASRAGSWCRRRGIRRAC